ncbi:MAG: fumarylacetoacetate hydrolase family protein [Rubrivivax sp.]|jgi:2-keto-4-pentenoate hydratase/2-oxohepta-3-ene-1,7-dioic acid hydratase in catechol pathway|nr:fumarylacetoacetate hydrolase family protein [Rubrivivax sp.]
MTLWLRYSHQGRTGFGTLDDDHVAVHDGSMLDAPRPTGQRLPLAAVQLLTPCEPRQMVGLWNNYGQLAEKMGYARPEAPLWFLKSPSSFNPSGAPIPAPRVDVGKVVYEGELGVVIGRRTAGVSEAEAAAHIFGYTCVNDVTAIDLLQADPSFPQWARAKGLDGFGCFGPVISTTPPPPDAEVVVALNGRERQRYPIADMLIPPARLVSLLSRELTLLPGDVIACGTSLGVLPMRPGTTVTVTIAGIGTLANVYAPADAAAPAA